MNDLFNQEPIEWYKGGEMSSAHNRLSYKKLVLPDDFVLVCYPRDGTPVCTKELQQLQKNLDKFALPVYVASTDSPETHNTFFNNHKIFKEDIEFPVLSLGEYMLTDFGKLQILNEYGYCHRVTFIVMGGSVVSVYRTPDDVNPDMQNLIKLVKQIVELG